MREVHECRHCHGSVKRADLHDHGVESNKCFATWTCVNPNCRSSSDIAAMACSGDDDETEQQQAVPAADPVGFAPGKYVRLKHNTAGLPAGARGMLSGEVLTRPEDRDKLKVVFRSYVPGSPEYGDLKVPREDLEWDSERRL